MEIRVKKDIGLGVKDSQPISISICTPKQKEPPKQTYGIIHNEQPVIKQESFKELNKDSIIDKINTGFGCDNTLHKDCLKPQWHQHLCKENFLGEFKTELEKQLARDNLNVYSKAQIDEFIKNLSGVDLSSFITRDDLNEAIQDLDFVKSSLKSKTDYNIPENLFIL